MNLKVSIPDNVNEIKLSSFQRFIKIEEPTDYDVLDCFYNIKQVEGFKMNAKDVRELVSTIYTLLNQEAKELETSFVLNGVEYGFIPNLDDITYGENTDIISYINEPKQWHKAMAVLYRPIIKKQFGKYLIEDYEGSQKYERQMRDAPLGVFLSAQVFFYDLVKDFMSCIPAFIQKESQHHLAENGELIRQYTDSLEETFTDLKESLNNHSISV